MSAGYVPQTDEELEALRANLGMAPQPVADQAAHEREVLASASGPAVGLPGGGVLGDVPPEIAATRALNFGPPAGAPPVAPPVAPALGVTLPPPAPLAPPPPAAAAPRPAAPRRPGGAPSTAGLNTGAEERKLYGEEERLSNEAVTAEQKAGEVKKQIAGVEATNAQDLANQKLAAAQQQQQVIAAANQRTQQWADRAQAESEKFQKMDFHDYWADKSTGNKVLAGLAMLTGAAGRTDNSTNPGMKMINDAIERDFRMQQVRIDKQKQNVAAARDQYELGLSQKQQALADNRLQEAAAYDAAAAKAIALKMKMGVPLEQAQTDKDVVALRQKGNAVRLETLKEIHGQNVQDAQLGIQRAHLGIEREKLGIEREKAKTGASALAQERLDIQRDRLLNTEVGQWATQQGIPKAVAARDKLLDVQEKVNDPKASPVTLASAIMEFDSAARQGTATKASFDALQAHLSPGLFAKVQAAAAHGTGNFTAREREELRKGVAAGVHASDEEGKRLHESFKSTFYGNPKLQAFKDELGARSEGLFNRWGYESDATRARKAKETGAAGGAGGGAPPDRGAAAQAAVARMRNPNETPERREAARQFLISIGAPAQ